MNQQFLLYCSRTNEPILYIPEKELLVTNEEISEVSRQVIEFLVVNKVFTVIGEV